MNTSPVRVGSAAQIAGRSMPGSVFRTNFAVPIKAPVLPALTQACASPDFTRSIATRIEESFLVRIAVRMSSSMPTTSDAGTTASRESLPAGWRASSFERTSGRPTRRSSVPSVRPMKSRQAGTVTEGP